MPAAVLGRLHLIGQSILRVLGSSLGTISIVLAALGLLRCEIQSVRIRIVRIVRQNIESGLTLLELVLGVLVRRIGFSLCLLRFRKLRARLVEGTACRIKAGLSVAQQSSLAARLRLGVDPVAIQELADASG